MITRLSVPLWAFLLTFLLVLTPGHADISGFYEVHRLQVGQARVAYREAGSGPALVLFHGFPLSGLTWRKMIPFLSMRHTVYAFDVIGFGDSNSTNDQDFTSQGQARVFQKALRLVGINTYSLMGNDSGGWIARELALLEPEKVTHLILTNTEIPFQRPPWIPTYQRLSRFSGNAVLFHEFLSNRLWLHSAMGFGNAFADPSLIDGAFGRLFLDPLRNSRSRILSAMRFLTHMDFKRVDGFAREHHRLSMPVALFWGEDDRTFPVDLAEVMATQFPHGIFVRVPKGKLFFQEEQPRLLSRLVLDFLQGEGP